MARLKWGGILENGIAERRLGFGGYDDGGFLDFDEAGTGTLFEFGQNFVHFFARLNELDLDGEIIGDLEDVRGMEAVRGSESCNTLEDRGACDAAVKKIVENAGVDRDTVMLGSIAQVDRDFNGLSGCEHWFLSAWERGWFALPVCLPA